MNTGLQARVYDPLWLLARQWQIGEFQGEDSGSPAIGAVARRVGALHPLRAGRARRRRHGRRPGLRRPRPSRSRRWSSASRCARGPTALERLRFAADAGRHFLRVLGQQALSRELRRRRARGVPAAAALPTPSGSSSTPRARRSSRLMGGRVPDGRALYEALGASLRPPPPRQPALPPAPGDRACRRRRGDARPGMLWLQWVDTLFTEPATGDAAWTPERMEYGFSLAARTSRR